jgi:hypothetical protein
LSAAQSGHQA